MNRFYAPVPAGSGQWNNHYAVRDIEDRKTYCADMRLSWDQADRLCDVFAEIRQRSLTLPMPEPVERAA